jgi:hypothetical protein
VKKNRRKLQHKEKKEIKRKEGEKAEIKRIKR